MNWSEQALSLLIRQMSVWYLHVVAIILVMKWTQISLMDKDQYCLLKLDYYLIGGTKKTQLSNCPFSCFIETNRVRGKW